MVIDGGSGGPGRPGDGAPRRGRPGRAPRIEQPQTVIRLPKDPYEGEFKAPRGRRGRGVLALAALVVVVSVIIAISSSKHNNGAASQGASTGVGGGVPPATATVGQSAPASAPSSPAFPSQNGDVLTGYPDTQDGATAAAANFVAAYGSEAMMTANSRHKLVQEIADPAIVTTLQQQLDQAFTLAAQGFGLDKNGNAPTGQSFVSRAVPFGTTVANYSAAKATVAVWINMISGTAGQGSTHPVSETWSTVTLNLTWVNGDWKWSSFTQADGPTPVPAGQQVSSSSDLQKAVQQFARLRYAP
ncbi:hypothetical protein [Catenulispora pinisilvae]|uniref:hypothetical protein n=1 Tax=Catenulispora pinisilvae TaxID=2705253 RepID=UPI00189104C8|nr:hypothetical protein [Catenulispora pinisilvae]